MTVKQKAARAKFTKAIAEAKKLRAKNPKLTQAAAVKQAFAILYSKDKPKKVGAVKKKAAVKKEAPKKKAAVKKTDSYHKDTKSHNVNIRVISGIDKYHSKVLDELNYLHNKINNLEVERDRIKSGIKYKQYSKEQILKARNMVKNYTEYIKELKQNIKTVKKGI
jgi:hypothetical protein